VRGAEAEWAEAVQADAALQAGERAQADAAPQAGEPAQYGLLAREPAQAAGASHG
jgi:hypothetical protein